MMPDIAGLARLITQTSEPAAAIPDRLQRQRDKGIWLWHDRTSRRVSGAPPPAEAIDSRYRFIVDILSCATGYRAWSNYQRRERRQTVSRPYVAGAVYRNILDDPVVHPPEAFHTQGPNEGEPLSWETSVYLVLRDEKGRSARIEGNQRNLWALFERAHVLGGEGKMLIVTLGATNDGWMAFPEVGVVDDLRGTEPFKGKISLGKLAVAFAKRGFAVFPLAPGSKTPLGGSSGCLDATEDIEQIKAWWAVMPDCNIGIATGNTNPLGK